MVTLIGLLACLASAALPFAVQPDPHLLEAGAVSGLICAVGLLLPSLGFAVTGAIAAILVFSAALLIAPSGAPIIEAVLLGVALLALLDATYYRGRFGGTAVARPMRRAHLASLGISVIASVGAAVLLVALAATLPLDLTAWFRPLAAAAGGILVMSMFLRGTGRQRGNHGSEPS
jgi:hypothetical protein